MAYPVFKDTDSFRFDDLYLHAINAPAGYDILKVCLDIAQMLIDKNISYGNSALSPVRIFSKADSVEQIKVRLDDKLNRLKNGSSFAGDNDIDDMLGYLVLLKIAMSQA
jgi:hypothetical protein